VIFSALPADLLAMFGSREASAGLPFAISPASSIAAPPSEIPPELTDFGSFLELVGSLVDGEEVAISSTSFLVELPVSEKHVLKVRVPEPPPAPEARAMVTCVVETRAIELPLPVDLPPPVKNPEPLLFAPPRQPLEVVQRPEPPESRETEYEECEPAEQAAPVVIAVKPEAVAQECAKAAPHERPALAPALRAPQPEQAPRTERRTQPPPVAFVAEISERPRPTAQSATVVRESVETPVRPDVEPELALAADAPKDVQPAPKREATTPDRRGTDSEREPAQRSAPAPAPRRHSEATPPALPQESAPPPQPVVSAPIVQKTSAVNSPATPETQPAPVREVVVQVRGAEGERVEVQIVERAGAVRVHVRTDNVELTASLRTNLGELVRSITEKGLHIETWTPAETWPSAEVAAIGEREPALRSEPATETQTPADEHRRGRARQQWLEEFERRLDRS
jgi:hypothetical protein